MELSKVPNSPTWPLLCAQPLETSSNVVSHRRSAHKTEEVPPYDFQVSLVYLEYPNLFLLMWLRCKCHRELSDEPLDAWLPNCETIEIEPVSMDP